MRLLRLTLTNFRNYAALTWRPAAPIIVLHGPNGSGKTNLLEAVSLLVPGRGLRGARTADLPSRGGPGTWAVAGRFSTPEGGVDIGTGSAPSPVPNGSPNAGRAPGATSGATSGAEAVQQQRRVFRLDGVAPRSQAEVAARTAAVWLTPQMDRLFLEGLAGRRRFLDRLVWALEPDHARQMAAYDTAMGSRSRLLAEGRPDRAWLAGLEDAMARHAVAATAARTALVARLNAVLPGDLAGGLDGGLYGGLAAGIAGGFPAARIGLICPIADRLAAAPALDVEDWLRAALNANRSRDAAAGTTALGAHRTDLTLADAATGVEAALASTGEQRALLIGTILAHAALIAEARGFAPLLLLDEPTIHLDPDRRAALFAALVRLPAQTFITGTDADTFLPLADHAEGLRTGGGTLIPDARFQGPKTPIAPVVPTL